MSRAVRLVALLLLGVLAFIAVSCESEEKPRGPEDSASGLPWNRPMPGERSNGPLGGMPFQSH
ncbi:MAG TPA: hypothetical protein VGH65_07505 [Verrucomicrobiaceae bacterium]|jgi:hypothetical protein